ncbi:MAG: hypothetical protein BYD32DRAFT_423921 [Podila humilis]|nr:MAG: hypothetical protein BYD32DRAFT_423921 [Podila humilis]
MSRPAESRPKRKRAIDLPEIVTRIAWFITPWRPHPKEKHNYEFFPRHVLACIKVNRLWRDTFTPVLWTVFNEEAMALRNIPDAIIRAHSCHIRFLEVTKDRATNPFQTTQLRRLTMKGWNHYSVCTDLVVNNPGLTELEWMLPQDNKIERLTHVRMQLALESLRQLTALFLGDWRFYTNQLIRILRTKPVLEKLSLFGIEGIAQLQEGTTVESLTHLFINSDWKPNPGLAELFQYFPNLDRLVFQPDDDCPITEISSHLRKTCKKVTAIQAVDAYMFSYGSISEKDQVDLIVSTPNCVELDFAIPALSANVARALLSPQLKNLRNLHLNVSGNTKVNLGYANRILASVNHNLTHFILINVASNWSSKKCMALFERPWASPTLEYFKLGGIGSPGSDAFTGILGHGLYGGYGGPAFGGAGHGQNDADNPPQAFNPDPFVSESSADKLLAKNGWKLLTPAYYSTSVLDSRYSSILLKRLLKQVFILPRMRSVTFENHEYAKIGTQ